MVQLSLGDGFFIIQVQLSLGDGFYDHSSALSLFTKNN